MKSSFVLWPQVTYNNNAKKFCGLLTGVLGEHSMVDATIKNELANYLDQMKIEQQRQVLEFARSLTSSPSPGVPGASLLRFAGTISEADLEAMSQAIKEGCEGVHSDEW